MVNGLIFVTIILFIIVMVILSIILNKLSKINISELASRFSDFEKSQLRTEQMLREEMDLNTRPIW
jgi:hypothetical protein